MRHVVKVLLSRRWYRVWRFQKQWFFAGISSWGVVWLFCSSPFVIRLKQLTDHWLSSQFGAANWMDNQWPVGFLRRMTNGDEWGRMKKRNNTSTLACWWILSLLVDFESAGGFWQYYFSKSHGWNQPCGWIFSRIHRQESTGKLKILLISEKIH